MTPNLGNLQRFFGTLGPLGSTVLLIAALLVAFKIGVDSAERHRAQYDCKKACKKAWKERQDYRRPESESASAS